MSYPVRLAALAAGLGVALAPIGQQPGAQPAKQEGGADVSGSYDVRFEEIANNCTDTGMQLRTGSFTLTQKRGRELEVSFSLTPIMYGKVNEDGKFRAEAKKGGTAIRGVDGQFSVAGRVNVSDRAIQLVFIAEYYRGNTPLCTQSWNASGARARGGS
jgi:hypothetical protein